MFSKVSLFSFILMCAGCAPTISCCPDAKIAIEKMVDIGTLSSVNNEFSVWIVTSQWYSLPEKMKICFVETAMLIRMNCFGYPDVTIKDSSGNQVAHYGVDGVSIP